MDEVGGHLGDETPVFKEQRVYLYMDTEHVAGKVSQGQHACDVLPDQCHSS